MTTVKTVKEIMTFLCKKKGRNLQKKVIAVFVMMFVFTEKIEKDDLGITEYLYESILSSRN